MLIPALALSFLAGAPMAPTFERPELLVWSIQGEGVKKKVPGWVTERVARRAAKNPHVELLSAVEVKRLAGLEAERLLLGAPDEGRMAALAKKTNAKLVVFGTARFINRQVQVELQLFAVDDARAVARVAAAAPTLDALGPKLDAAVDSVIDRVLDAPAPDANAAAARLLDELGVSAGSPRPLLVADTPFSSAFGSLFADALAAKLKKGEPQLIGSYRENRDVVEIALATVVDDAVEKRAQARLLKASTHDAALRPANLSRVVEEQRVLKAQRAGDLELSAWTEKGSVGVVFAEDDEFHFFVKVNKPAWVRIIYHLANGDRALLEQAWKVDALDEPVRYPDAFSAASPFGIERVQFIAFAEAPPPLRSSGKTIEGTSYRLIESLDDIVRYRGFKRVKTAGFAEALITLTTTPR